MKKWLLVIGLVMIVGTGGFLVLSFYGAKLLRTELQKTLGPGLHVTEIKVKPTHLSLKGIRYDDPTLKERLFRVEEIRVYPALLASLQGRVGIREVALLKPSFFFFRSQEGIWTLPIPPRNQRGKDRSEEEKRDEKPSVQIHRLQIEDGTVDVEDRKTGGPPAHVHLKDLDLEMEEIQYPFASIHSPIELKGRLKGVTKEGSFHMKGWIDLKTLDMETSFQSREIEVKTFEPYYRKRVSAEIQSGLADLGANIAVRQRTIDAPGTLELTDLRIQEGGGTVLWMPAKTLVSVLKDKGNRIKVRFRVKGNIDDPHFNLRENLATQIAISVAEALGVPIKVVGEEVLGGSLKGTEGFVEGLKSFGEMFKRKEQKR